MLSFTICQNETTHLMTTIDIWEDDGEIDIFTKDNAKNGGKTYNISLICLNFMTQMMKFKTKANG